MDTDPRSSSGPPAPVLHPVAIATADMLTVEHYPTHTVVRLLTGDTPGKYQHGPVLLALTPDAKIRLINLLQAWEHNPPHVLITPTPTPRAADELRQEVEYG